MGLFWFRLEFSPKRLILCAELFLTFCLIYAYEYPTLNKIPETGFVCGGHPPGYYADPHPLARCQVFHMCNMQGRHYSYLCPNHTLFHQERLICEHWKKVNCSNIESRWHVNDQLYPDLQNYVDQPVRKQFHNKSQRNVDIKQNFRVKNKRTNNKCGSCLLFYVRQGTGCNPCAIPR